MGATKGVVGAVPLVFPLPLLLLLLLLPLLLLLLLLVCLHLLQASPFV